jgi:hypothetical protein
MFFLQEPTLDLTSIVLLSKLTQLFNCEEQKSYGRRNKAQREKVNGTSVMRQDVIIYHTNRERQHGGRMDYVTAKGNVIQPEEG